jgi:dTDP-L-rhamnose 4-epimerase
MIDDLFIIGDINHVRKIQDMAKTEVGGVDIFLKDSDDIDATILGLEKEEANNQIFNVGTGTPTDVYTVAKQLIENYRKEVPITISGNYRLGDIRHNFADITKISSMLNFVPKISFNQGLEKFTNWVNSQEIQEDYYQKSIEEMKVKGLYK